MSDELKSKGACPPPEPIPGLLPPGATIPVKAIVLSVAAMLLALVGVVRMHAASRPKPTPNPSPSPNVIEIEVQP